VSVKGWIAVDFDGTLSVFVGNYTNLGPPVPLMVQKVKDWLSKGYEVRIFTARVAHKNPEKKQEVRQAIEEWCVTHIGERLQVTNEKDFNCIAIYDDKAVSVRKNTGLCLRKGGYR
jgi:hypothetical protein